MERRRGSERRRRKDEDSDDRPARAAKSGGFAKVVRIAIGGPLALLGGAGVGAGAFGIGGLFGLIVGLVCLLGGSVMLMAAFKRFCPECALEVVARAKKCPHCGQWLAGG